MEKIKIIIAGGGTGGHIFPALAIADKIKKENKNSEILFVGAEGKMEMERVPKAGYDILALPIVGLERKKIWKNIGVFFKLLQSNKKAKKILKDFKPDLVIGVGGYASFPILKVAQSLGIPTLIQEQNSFAGKSNKWLGKKADSICVAYDGMDKFFPKNKIVKTGNPVREQIKKFDFSNSEVKTELKLSKSKMTIGIVGGSLGAMSINKTIEKNCKKWIDEGYQIIWQTGKLYSPPDTIKQLSGLIVATFFEDIEKLYAASDLIISRAGALACAELAIAGKPVIFVPYPYAAENHQYSNALSFVEAGAALVVNDNEVENQLPKAVNNILENENLQREMQTKMKKCALTEAEDLIWKEINKIIKK
ncbi:MAG TPA: undecaprenyldiphospho-muramoylpentapeptide beta-N-acetylglucosaminyltransferase [Chitinophagaceae bacterium]|nr:undecaprenyldiphospho-muramoylpentapeptide beta-N-acetylglucosaminyltransferase [Chitinophagaceae bacterium]